MGDKPCSECKWFVGGEDCLQPGDICRHKNAAYIRPVYNRQQSISCGPSGRYWEPKDDRKNE